MFIASIFSWCAFLTTYLLCCRYYPKSNIENKSLANEKVYSEDELINIMKVSITNICLSLPWALFWEIWIPVIYVPSWYLRIPISILLFDMTYYLMHRAVHNVIFLKQYHYMHHTRDLPHPSSTFYASVAEHLIINMGSVGLYPYIFDFTTFEMIIWFIGVALFTSMLHSTFNISEYFHMIHHYKRCCNYSIYGLTDLLMGSYNINRDIKIKRVY